MQNIAEFKILAINKTALSTNSVVDRKRLNVSIKKVSYIIS